MFDSIVSRVRSFLGTSANVEPQREPRIIPKEVHGIDPELVAWQAKRCCEALQRRGYRAYIVGGAVRDLLLGVAPKDFDVATDATPEEVKRAQKRAIIIGRRFRLVHVIFGQEIIECSTFRALEGAGVRKDSSGRVISDNVFGEMWEDAARRDFTINALYYDPATEEIYDYHHGFEDLGKKRLRMIGNPEERYREDPVRMIRAVRISAKLGFAIEPATERPIARMAKLLSNVPSARLVDEALKLLTCGHAVECVSRLRKEGLAEAVLPTLNRLLATPDGEAFLMLALRRTDERLAIGKRISPFFLFATLLWPQVRLRWQHNEEVRGLPRLAALHDAQMGEVPEALPEWWDHFVQADSDERAEMVKAAQIEARQTGEDARRGRRAALQAGSDAPAGEERERRRPRRRPRRSRSRRPVDHVGSGSSE